MNKLSLWEAPLTYLVPEETDAESNARAHVNPVAPYGGFMMKPSYALPLVERVSCAWPTTVGIRCGNHLENFHECEEGTDAPVHHGRQMKKPKLCWFGPEHVPAMLMRQKEKAEIYMDTEVKLSWIHVQAFVMPTILRFMPEERAYLRAEYARFLVAHSLTKADVPLLELDMTTNTIVRQAE